jgi:hypothetical protein
METPASEIDFFVSMVPYLNKMFGTPGASPKTPNPSNGVTVLRLNKMTTPPTYTMSKTTLAAFGVTYADLVHAIEKFCEDLKVKNMYAKNANARNIPCGPFLNFDLTVFPYFKHRDQLPTYPLVEISGDTAFLRFDLADKANYNLRTAGWDFCASMAYKYATETNGVHTERYGTCHDKAWTMQSASAVAKHRRSEEDKGMACLEYAIAELKTKFGRAYPCASVRWTMYRCETSSPPVSFFQYVEVSDSDDEENE